MTNQTPTVFKSQLAKINDTYMPQIESQLRGNGINMTEYQRTVTINAISAINEMLTKEGLSLNDVDQSNITQMLMKVAALQLNAMATPREVYFIKRKQKNKNGTEIQIVEMGIEGDGNDAILSRFGRNVKTVHRHWEVRENDVFTYPKQIGLDLTPPTWERTGKGKVIRVVYPIEFLDGDVSYEIGEREDVKKNLIAHMFNNLMWDNAKVTKKAQIKEFSEDHTLDEMLDSKEMQELGNISPAWKDPHSRESMIVRKMRNNVVKNIPKDFSNAYVQSAVESVEADFNEREYLRKEAEIIEEVEQNANKEVLDPPQIVENTKTVNTETGEITSEPWQAADLDERNFDEKVADGTITPIGEDDPY
nr:MAG TPA: RecT family protein [Caudoviricetes sp.]